MNRAMWIAKTAVDAQQTRMSVVSNNLANVSTTGFKKDRAVFADLIYQNIRQVGAQSSENSQLPSGLRLGTGVRVVATEKMHTQGNLIHTDNAYDVAVEGRGAIDRICGEHPDRADEIRERVELEGLHHWHAARARGSGVIGVSLHMGNWEVAILPFTWAGANPAAVYRSVTNPYVDRYLRAQRKDLYPGGLFGRGKVGDHGDDQKTARAIMDYVRRGGRLSVFVVHNSGAGPQVALRAVRVGRTDRDRVEIREGLDAGERVVTDGQFALRDGSPVFIETRSADS